MSSWKECKLGDIAEILNHVRVPLSAMERAKMQGKFPYYGASGIIDYVDDYLFDGEYVLISEDGENLKSRKTPIAFKASGKFWVNNHAHIVQGKKPFLNDLIVYYFKNLDLNEYITGAVQPKLNKANLLEIPFYLPKSEEEQKAIAEVLSSLDDKIDLLHRQNQTLESLAQTLFRQWFIEEAKEKWEIGTFDDLVEVSSGKSLKRELFDDMGKYEVLGANGKIGKTNEWLFEEKLIYTGRVGTLGNVFLIDEDKKVWLSDNTLVVKPKKYFYLIYFLMIDFQLENLNVGSTQPLVRQSDLKNIEILLPNDEIVLRFEQQSKNIFKKINQNKKQIQTLENLRDTLLPKLLSGEVRVKI